MSRKVKVSVKIVFYSYRVLKDIVQITTTRDPNQKLANRTLNLQRDLPESSVMTMLTTIFLSL